MTGTVIPDMAIDEEVKTVLDEHGNRIKAVEIDITELKINDARTEEKLVKIEQNQLDLKTIVLQGNTSMMSTLQQLLISKDNKDISKSTNRTNIIIQVIIGIGVIAGVIFAK